MAVSVQDKRGRMCAIKHTFHNELRCHAGHNGVWLGHNYYKHVRMELELELPPSMVLGRRPCPYRIVDSRFRSMPSHFFNYRVHEVERIL